MNPLSNNSNDVKWLSMSEASDHTPYSAEYLSLLARKGKLASKKINGVWYTTKSALDEYMQKQMLRAQVLGNSYPTPAQKLPETQVVQAVPAAPTTPDEPALDASIYDEASLKKLRSFHADIRAYMEREGLPLPKEEEIAPARNTTDVLKLAEQDYSERTIAQEFLPNIPQKNVVADTLGAVRQETHAGIEKTLEKVLDKKLGGGTVQFGSGMASLPVLPRRSWKTVSASRMLLVATLILMVGLTTLPVPFVFSSFENAGSALKKWATDANTVMGFRPGTHKNELLLLDKDGNVAITGSVEAGGQLASYAADGVAPIIVTSKTQVNNLNAEFLNGASSTDFTLAFVTKNGSVTTEDVQLLGSVEVGKSLLVKGATKLLSSLAVDGDLAVFGNAEFNQALTVLGPARFKQLLAVEDNLTVGKNASIRGSLTVGRSVNAGSGTFTSLGTGDFSATGQVSLGASNKTLTVDAKNVSIDKDGNASFGGLITASTLNLTGSGTSTVAGPVVFNGSVSLQGSGTLASLSVTGSTTLADLLVTGSSSLQNLTFVDATGSSATTTNFFSSKLSSLLASISSLVADDISVGALTATSSVTTNATTTNATTTNMFAANASSTNLYSTYANTGSIVFGDATGTNATTTNLFSHIGTFDDVYVNNYQQNNGTFTINSTVPTGDIFSVFDTAITDGTLIHQSLTANAGNGEVSKGQIIDLVDDTVAGGGYSALTVNVTGSGIGSGVKTLLDLNPGANKEIVFDANGALRPTVDASQNITSIGTPSYYFKNGYFDTITANAISGTVITGSTASHTWTIGANETGDVNEAIIFQRNSGSGNALFQWNASNGILNDQRFLSVNYPFNATYTINDSSIATSSSLYSGLFTNNTTSGTQKLLSLTNTGTGTTEDGIYVNNTGTGATGIEIAGTWTTGIKTNNNSINAGTGALSAGFATFANILATGSTTLQNFTAANSTTTNATTTNFFSTNASSTNLFFTAANGGTQTLSGLLTAANLLVTGSTSLQNFTFTNATGTNATTTNFYATNATLGNLSLTNLIFTNATGTNATTTNFYSTVASSTNLFSTTLAVGGDKLVVTSGGNVGIGITNPSSKLTVAGGDVTISGSTNGLVFANNQSIRDGGASGDLNLFTPTTGAAINFNTTNGNILFNPGTMSVGIGTSTPKGMLQVARDVGALPTTNVYGQLELTLTSSPVNRLSLGYSSTYDAGFIQAVANAVGFKKLLLNPSGGNVGIGTTNPNGVLEVAFSNASTGGIGTSNAIVINNTDTTASNWAGTSYATLTTGGVGAIGATIGMQTTSRSIIGVTSDLIFSTSNNAASPSEVLRIKANGNVGVGTTTPTLSRLEVDQVTGASGGFDVARFINPSGNGNASGVYIQTTEGNAAGTYALRVAGGSGARNLLEVRNNGNIGIGTTTPNQLLTLYSATTPSINLSTGAGGAQWTAGIDTADAGKFKIASSTAVGTNTRLTIDGNGNVGFGTTTPVSIIAASASRPALTLSKSNTGQNWTMLAGANSSFYIKPNVPSADGTDSDYSLYIDTSSNAGIKGNLTVSGTGNSSFAGNVGIGTTNPQAPLNVAGNALFGGTNAGAVGNVQVVTNGASPINNRITYGTDGTGWKFSIGKNQGGTVTDQLTIQDNGNVGIGITNPGNARLNIQGVDSTSGNYALFTQNSSNTAILVARNDGNVGVGTTNPASFGAGAVVTEVHGTSAYGALLTSTNSVTGQMFASESGAVYMGSRSSHPVYFTTGNSAQVGISTGGNVGIGSSIDTSYPLSLTPTSGTPTETGIKTTVGANSIFLAHGGWGMGTGKFGIGNGSVPSIVVDGVNNRIGIGTTNPAVKLDFGTSVPNVSQIIDIYNNGAGNVRSGIGMDSATAGMRIFGSTAGGPLLAVGSISTSDGTTWSEKFRVDNGGNVGIGTTNPVTKLEIDGAGQATQAFNTGGTHGATLYINDTASASTNQGGAIMFGAADYRFAAIKGLLTNGVSNGQGDLQFLVRTSATDAVLTNALMIKASGAVGIGTTNPGALLHVKSPTGDLVTRFEGLSNSYKSKMYISAVAAGDGGFQYDSNSNQMDVFSYGDLKFNVGTGNISGAIANERMRITQGGNVGIGITNPISPLTVNGGTTMTGGWNRTASLEATFPVAVFNSNGTRWGGIGYDYSVSGGTMRIFTGATTNDATGLNATTALSVNSSQVSVAGNLLFNGSLIGNGITVLSTADSYLRINQSNQFSSGIWLGTSDLKMHTSTLRIGSSGGAGEVEISGTAGDATTRVKINGNAGTGIQLLGGAHLELSRANAAQNGISWYDPSYNAWSEYMAQAGNTGAGPKGTLTAPSGSLVTSWALRSYVENSGGYGWTWESAANTGTPSVMFEVSSNNGSIRAAGNGTFAGGTLTIGSGTINQAQSTYGTLALASAKNSYYGLLFGQSSSNPNMMFDSSGNGGVYYESLSRWRDYYIPSVNHWNINTSTDLGATLGISGTLAVNNGDSSIATFGPNASWGSYLKVGAATNAAASGVAQVISTNGNLHLDAGTSQDMYLNYFSAGRPIHANGPIDTGYNITGAGAPTSGYNFNIGSIGASTVYGYTALCTGNVSGACDGGSGVVLGRANSSAFTNFPNSGNSTVGGQLGVVGNIVQGSGAVIYPGSVSGLSANQTSYYLASHASWGLYTNTSFNIQGVYDVGNRVCSAATCNLGSQTISSGNITVSGNSPSILLSSGNDDSRMYFTSTSLSIRGEPGQSLSFYTNASSRQAYFDPNGFHLLSGGVQFPNLHGTAPACSASNRGLVAAGVYAAGAGYDTLFICGYMNGLYSWNYVWSPTTANTNPDLAEYVPVQDDSIAAGEVVALSDVPNLAGTKPYDSFYAERASAEKKDKVLGVVSTNPGLILNEKKVQSANLDDYATAPDTSGLKPLALAGRVPVKVTAENGAVQAGDYITVSDTVPGAAMKMTTAGNAIGQALDNYDPATGTVLVLVGKTYFTNGISIEDLKNRMVVVENDIEMLKTVASSTAARIDTLETRVLALESASSTGLTFDATTTNPIVSGMLAVLGSTIIDGVTHFKDVVVAALTVGSHENPTGITIYDTATGNPYCFKVTNGATVNVPGKCGQETSTPSAPSAPVISSGTPDTTASSTSSTTASSTPSTDTASSTPTTDTASSTPSTDTAPSTSTDTSTATATSGTDTSTTASGTTTASASDAPTTTS